MTRKKSKETSVKQHTCEALRWLIGPSRWARFVRFSSAAGILISLCCMGLGELDRYVRKHPSITSSQVVVSFYAEPQWMSSALAREILECAKRPIHEQLKTAHRNGQDYRLPELFYTSLAESGWVSTVHWIRRCRGGRMVVHCQFRRPAAAVVLGDWRYLVDEHGYLLPGKYRPAVLAGCGLLEIHGCGGSPPDAGMRWSNADVQSALKLATLLENTSYRRQIAAIDITNFAGRLHRRESWILLITDRNTVVKWGRPPGGERGLEITAREKLNSLKELSRRHGHIDFGRACVDIRSSATEVDVSIASAETIEQ